MAGLVVASGHSPFSAGCNGVCQHLIEHGSRLICQLE
jgi:hypothetical protein